MLKFNPTRSIFGVKAPVKARKKIKKYERVTLSTCSLLGNYCMLISYRY